VSKSFHEHGSPSFQRLPMGGILGEIVLLAWILVQVKQLLRAVGGSPDVLEMAVGECMERLRLGAVG